LQRKQNCLEVAFTYLLGEVDLESSTTFFKNVRDLDENCLTQMPIRLLRRYQTATSFRRRHVPVGGGFLQTAGLHASFSQ
jgi:hypothetical protein